MPFLNHSVEPPFVDYTDLQIQYWIDVTNQYSSLRESVAILQWLNLLNPDWQRMIAGPEHTIGVLSGEGVFDAPGLAAIHLDVTAPVQWVNRWWDSNNIGKFGVVSPVQSGYVLQPMTFINHLHSSMKVEDQSYEGFYYNFQRGVTVTGRYSKWQTPWNSPSNKPEVLWQGNQDYINGMQLLTGGAAPNSTRGPETLP